MHCDVKQVAPCYPDHCKDFPAQLLELLETRAEVLDADLRRTIVQVLCVCVCVCVCMCVYVCVCVCMCGCVSVSGCVWTFL